MGFEFDPRKSKSNKLKHEIDFEAAQALWNDPSRLEIPVMLTGEPRTLNIGKIDNRYWTAIITYRGDNIRMISVRRSRKEEMTIYENLGV